ncbi:MAG: 4-(cytidine 5'-diphospho)-2-C-methyl-D-erythritol kinase [bacterium]
MTATKTTAAAPAPPGPEVSRATAASAKGKGRKTPAAPVARPLPTPSWEPAEKGPKVILESPAKINLNLEVLGQRGDGYHSIRSILVPISLHDTITIAPGGRKLSFHGGQGAPKDEGNLAYRAAVALADHAGGGRGVEIRIVKRIPIAAGLGGGSSNAATVLAGLNELWGLGLDGPTLEKIGSTLGSDVPFFLRRGMNVATGRGEVLEAVPNRLRLEVVLVNPPVKVSSEWAYANVPEELTRSGSSTSMIKVALASGRVELLGRHLSNDLEPGVRAKHPVVGQIAKKLESAGALGVLMSGSGPTVFGIAADAESADRIAEKLSGDKWKVFRAHTLG